MKRKQATDVSLSVSLVGVVYLLEVGSFTTVATFTQVGKSFIFSI